LPRIDFKAVAIAFVAELGADAIIQNIVFFVFAQDYLADGISQQRLDQVQDTILKTTSFRPCIFVLGMITTVLGGYLAARLARRIPYYHGLAMGTVGIVFSLALWNKDAVWYDYVGLLLTIPASIFGAHFARPHMPQES